MYSHPTGTLWRVKCSFKFLNFFLKNKKHLDVPSVWNVCGLFHHILLNFKQTLKFLSIAELLARPQIAPERYKGILVPLSLIRVKSVTILKVNYSRKATVVMQLLYLASPLGLTNILLLQLSHWKLHP